MLGSFSVSVKLESVEEGFFWITSLYGSNKSHLRKDFWMEIQGLFGLTQGSKYR